METVCGYISLTGSRVWYELVRHARAESFLQQLEDSDCLSILDYIGSFYFLVG
jgi:hypothetical protein